MELTSTSNWSANWDNFRANRPQGGQKPHECEGGGQGQGQTEQTEARKRPDPEKFKAFLDEHPELAEQFKEKAVKHKGHGGGGHRHKADDDSQDPLAQLFAPLQADAKQTSNISVTV